MLSCSCEWDGESWWNIPPDDFTILKTNQRKRCRSCNKLIDIGSACIAFERYRCPVTNIEERICGDEVQLASRYLCEWCGEMYLNLEALGYCYFFGDSLVEIMQEYWELTGFKPANF